MAHSKTQDVPEWLAELPPKSDEEWWQHIEAVFGDLNDTINQVHLETKKQAVLQRHGAGTRDHGVYWPDPEADEEVRAWFQVPFDPARDEDHFREIWDAAKEFAKSVKPKIAKRELDVQFLVEWGAFCKYASIIEYEYLRGRPNLQHLRGAAMNSAEERRLWYSHLFMKLRQSGDRQVDTELRVLDFLHGLLERGEFPDSRFPKSWFRAFLSKSGDDLVASVKNKKLSLQEIDNLAGKPLGGLPPLDL